MERNAELQQTLELLTEQQLGKALDSLENYLLTHSQPQDTERLEAIRADYGRMADFWQQGFADPARRQVYEDLLRRAYVLWADLDKNDVLRHSAYLMSVFVKARSRRRDWAVASLRQSLESHVSEVAMLQLEQPHLRASREQQLYASHYELQSDLFGYVLTSRCWKEQTARAFLELLASPTVDSTDQQLLVSAVSLSLMSTFDMNKFWLLLRLYQQATDEQVRQRALVGWVCGLDSGRYGLYPALRQLVAEAVADSRCQQELKELQKQLVYCLRAEDDNRKIQSEIMPSLLENSNFRVTRDGIVEKEEDPLDDILHPEASEQAMERVEESFRKMMDMQKQGSDIYFGGFSQMKRFPFFGELCNWFVPFYQEHPALNAAMAALKGNRFFMGMMQSGPFCNSDKYSFTLAFQQVVSRIPENLRQMMEHGEAVMGVEMAAEEQRQPAYIRRTYLQDLYRFFRLHPHRSEFRNPFSQPLFVGAPVFEGTPLAADGAVAVEIAVFLMGQKMEEGACRVMGAQRLEAYERIVSRYPESERALLNYARALFAGGDHQAAAAVYDRLLLLKPGKKSYLLNKAVCLTNGGDSQGALKLLYELDYTYPEDANVRRVLAWTQVCDGRLEQATEAYRQFLAAEEPQAEDFLNAGYCSWLCGHIGEAIGRFARFRSLLPDKTFDFEKEFARNGMPLLEKAGIGSIEVKLMLDQLRWQ